MAFPVYNVLNVLHVLGAAVLVGYFSVIPMWRASARRAADPAVLPHALDTMQTTQMRLVGPALGLLVLTGLGMTVGPWRRFDLLEDRWTLTGLMIWAALAIILVAGLTLPMRKMRTLLANGEGVGPAMDKLWSDSRTAVLAGALISVVAVVLMVWQPGA